MFITLPSGLDTGREARIASRGVYSLIAIERSAKVNWSSVDA
jgi:hypothetical protein